MREAKIVPQVTRPDGYTCHLNNSQQLELVCRFSKTAPADLIEIVIVYGCHRRLWESHSIRGPVLPLLSTGSLTSATWWPGRPHRVGPDGLNVKDGPTSAFRLRIWWSDTEFFAWCQDEKAFGWVISPLYGIQQKEYTTATKMNSTDELPSISCNCVIHWPSHHYWDDSPQYRRNSKTKDRQACNKHTLDVRL
jgi:hypothetical protein